MQITLPRLVALGVAYMITPSVQRLAVRWAAVDKPEARKVHTGISPRWVGWLFMLVIWRRYLPASM